MTRLNGIVLAVSAAILMCGAARAQTFTEVKYNPEIGSRWQILSEIQSEETRPGSNTIFQTVKTTTEFSIDEKLPTGYRVSYVLRDLKLTGNAPTREIAETAFSAMKGIVVRGRTNMSGNPVAVDNFSDVKVSMNTVIDRLAKAFESKPAVANVMRQMLAGFLDVDASRAPEIYMEDLRALAAGQATGLAPGNVKREDEVVPSPLGGSIKSTLETRIESFEAAAGRVRYIRKRVFDKDSIKAVTIALTERLMAAAGKKEMTPDVTAQLRDVRLDLESETVITVEGGMTRTIDDRSFTTAQLMGQLMRKSEKKIMAVTRMN